MLQMHDQVRNSLYFNDNVLFIRYTQYALKEEQKTSQNTRVRLDGP